jgi:hypothetical protein
MKFVYYLGTQAIFNKYHSDQDPKLKSPSITFMQFAKFFEHKVTSDHEFQLSKTYEGPPFPNNEFAMSIYNKLYEKGKGGRMAEWLKLADCEILTIKLRGINYQHVHLVFKKVHMARHVGFNHVRDSIWLAP